MPTKDDFRIRVGGAGNDGYRNRPAFPRRRTVRTIVAAVVRSVGTTAEGSSHPRCKRPEQAVRNRESDRRTANLCRRSDQIPKPMPVALLEQGHCRAAVRRRQRPAVRARGPRDAQTRAKTSALRAAEGRRQLGRVRQERGLFERGARARRGARRRFGGYKIRPLKRYHVYVSGPPAQPQPFISA